MATSMFSRRHYEAIAAVLRDNRIARPELWEDIRDALSNLFVADNERFSRKTWEEACDHD